MSSTRHGHSTTNPEFGARSRQCVTGLEHCLQGMKSEEKHSPEKKPPESNLHFGVYALIALIAAVPIYFRQLN